MIYLGLFENQAILLKYFSKKRYTKIFCRKTNGCLQKEYIS